jgi:hypothetical protein
MLVGGIVTRSPVARVRAMQDRLLSQTSSKCRTLGNRLTAETITAQKLSLLDS